MLLNALLFENMGNRLACDMAFVFWLLLKSIVLCSLSWLSTPYYLIPLKEIRKLGVRVVLIKDEEYQETQVTLKILTMLNKGYSNTVLC